MKQVYQHSALYVSGVTFNNPAYGGSLPPPPPTDPSARRPPHRKPPAEKGVSLWVHSRDCMQTQRR